MSCYVSRKLPRSAWNKLVVTLFCFPTQAADTNKDAALRSFFLPAHYDQFQFL